MMIAAMFFAISALSAAPPQLRAVDFVGHYKIEKCSTPLFDHPVDAVVRLVGNDVTIGVPYPQAWKGSTRGAVFKHVNEGWKVDFQNTPDQPYEEEKSVSWTTHDSLMGITRSYSYASCYGLCAQKTKSALRFSSPARRELIWSFDSVVEHKDQRVECVLTPS